MDLKKINISSETLYARVDSIEDVFPAQSNTIHHGAVVDCTFHQWQLSAVVTNAEITLCENCYILARYVELLERFTEDTFAVTVGIEVGLMLSVRQTAPNSDFEVLSAPYPKY